MASLKKESIYLYLIQASNFIIPLVTLPYLTKVLGLSSLGKLGIAQSIFFFIGFIVDFGFTYSAARDISLSNDAEEKNKIFINIQFLRLLIFVLIALVSSIFVLTLNSSENELYLIAIFSSISFVLIPAWYFNGISSNSILALYTLLFKVLMLIPIFLFVKDESDYVIAFIVQNASLIILGVIIISYIKIKEKIRIKIEYLNIHYSLKKLSEGFDTFSGSAISIIYTTGVPFIIKLALGDYWVGVYVLVEKIVSILKQMFTPIMQACYSKICKLYESDSYREINKLNKIILSIYFFLVVVAMIFNYCFGDFIIEKFFGNQKILIEYIFYSIVLQFIVGCSLILIYGNIIPAGGGYLLKKIYIISAIIFSMLIFCFFDILTLSSIYYIIMITELCIVVFSVYLMKNKALGIFK